MDMLMHTIKVYTVFQNSKWQNFAGNRKYDWDAMENSVWYLSLSLSPALITESLAMLTLHALRWSELTLFIFHVFLIKAQTCISAEKLSSFLPLFWVEDVTKFSQMPTKMHFNRVICEGFVHTRPIWSDSKKSIVLSVISIHESLELHLVTAVTSRDK